MRWDPPMVSYSPMSSEGMRKRVGMEWARRALTKRVDADREFIVSELTDDMLTGRRFVPD